jgi:GNAT superfamily N-acetyltransferase
VLLRIEKLRREHRVDDFTCGRPELDRFLSHFAFPSQQANGSVTYVGLANDDVVGFYTLVTAHVAIEEAHERLVKGLGRYPVPLVVLARLAVRTDWQGRGTASGLLRDAMMRTLLVGDIVGVRALAVHAKDEPTASFYARFGFTPSPTDPLHLYMLIKDIHRLLRKET